MSHRVFITPPARVRIWEQARYIAVDCQSPLNAERWLEVGFDASDTLAEFPRRCALAPENDLRDYEIRRLRIGEYFLLFTIAEADRIVWVIGFRHGSQLPRSDELPRTTPDVESIDH